MKIETTKQGAKAIIARMRALTKSEVLVGIPDANAPRSNKEDEARKAIGEPINNAEIGYISEFGLPEKNIPARPFLIPGITAAKAGIGTALANGARKLLAGETEAGRIALTKAGLIGETAVKNRIDEGPFVPLAPATLKQRKTRKVAPRMGEKPLIDTGQLRNSVTHVVVPKGGK